MSGEEIKYKRRQVQTPICMGRIGLIRDTNSMNETDHVGTPNTSNDAADLDEGNWMILEGK